MELSSFFCFALFFFYLDRFISSHSPSLPLRHLPFIASPSLHAFTLTAYFTSHLIPPSIHPPFSQFSPSFSSHLLYIFLRLFAGFFWSTFYHLRFPLFSFYIFIFLHRRNRYQQKRGDAKIKTLINAGDAEAVPFTPGGGLP